MNVRRLPTAERGVTTSSSSLAFEARRTAIDAHRAHRVAVEIEVEARQRLGRAGLGSSATASTLWTDAVVGVVEVERVMLDVVSAVPQTREEAVSERPLRPARDIRMRGRGRGHAKARERCDRDGQRSGSG